MAVVTIAETLEVSPPQAPLELEMQLLRMADVVSITKFSRTKVYRLVASGDIPSLRSGKTVRVPLMGLRRWIADNSSHASHSSHVG